MTTRTQLPDFREFKRRRLDIDEPRIPYKVQGEGAQPDCRWCAFKC